MIYTENYTDEIKNMIHKGCITEYKDEQSDIYKAFTSKERGFCSNYEVPKKIHLCWIGSKIPNRYVPYVNSFVKHNDSTHEINLWVSHEPDQKFDGVIIRNVHDYPFFHKDKILKDPENNYARSSDILRLEVVHLFGGLYFDIDVMCLRKFDENFDHSLLSYIEHPWYNLQNAFFAFPKKSEFLAYAISCVDDCYGLEFPYSVGPTFMTTCCHAFDDKNIRMINQKRLGLAHHNFDDGVFVKHEYHKNW